MYLEYAELLHKLRIDGTRDMNKCTAFGDDRSIPADFFFDEFRYFLMDLGIFLCVWVFFVNLNMFLVNLGIF